ncbi:hypothetical protein H4219_002344 [Mycoemilia scoparia]|uniref:PCI domain-containing protein n=1 Tax=Mycoemilia scoparia TaxID=417184 RepID=A0A9W7ZY00_9FUNG|nr:hypothetical protein H4219_002344 [Mycoemilia scoparia]
MIWYLRYVATVCPSLEIKCCELALEETKSKAGQIPRISRHDEWIENTSKAAKSRLDELEKELGNAKSSMVKESNRLAQLSIANYLISIGSFSEAFKSLMNSREFVTKEEHRIELYLGIIQVGLFSTNFGFISSFFPHIEKNKDIIDKIPEAMCSIQIAGGLSKLDEGQYSQAATFFSGVTFSPNFDIHGIVSSRDVAIYGTMCGLAGYTRQQLRDNMLNNTDFKQFMQMEPWTLEFLENFYYARYSAFLKLLNKVQPYCLTDIYLANHTDALISEIRTRVLLFYTQIYSQVDINEMNRQLQWASDPELLEKDLIKLIQGGLIHGKVDSYSMVLHIYPPQLREEAIEKIEAMAPRLEAQIDLAKTRIQLIQEGHLPENLTPKDQGRENTQQ